MAELDEALCERARVARDARFDGQFFVGVRTTGVYCRPVCPVRLPRAENVRFFDTAAAAGAAGFRPCLRCRPETAPGTPAWQGTSTTVSRGLRLINEGALDGRSVGELAGRLGVTARHLSRLFDRHLGASPIAVAQTRRLQFAKKLLDETALTVTSVAMAAGYGSVRRFNDHVRQVYGKTPTQLRPSSPRPKADSGPRGAKAARKKAGNGAGTPGGEDEAPVTASSTEGLRLSLPYRAPFDWAALIGFFAARAIPGVERITADQYTRVVVDERGRAGCVCIRNDGEHHRLLCDLALPVDAIYGVTRQIRRMFDLDADPHAVADHLSADPAFAPLVRRYPGQRVPGAFSGFEVAVRAIVGQQISVVGATTVTARLVAGQGRAVGGVDGLDRAFPEPARLAEVAVGKLPMPRRREETIRALARGVASGDLDLGADAAPARLRADLLATPGIGPWTAEYIAMRVLNDPDAFLASDLVVRKAARRVLNVDGDKALVQRMESARPWRAYANMLLWRSEAEYAWE